MFHLQFLCILLIIGIGVNMADFGIDNNGYKYNHEVGAWLKLQTNRANFADARERCRLEGGNLATPKTRAMTKAMLDMIAADQEVADTGVLTGTAAGDDLCVTLLAPEGSPDYMDCTDKQFYFCRKENVNVTNKCGTNDSGYQWDARTGSCYKFHRNATTWHKAARTCYAEGGYLAIINSDTESQVLKEVFQKNPEDTITGAANTYVALIGFWKWDDKDGEWLTVKGETLAEAGFDKWHQGEPNNIEGIEYCGSVIRYSGRLNDVHCTVQTLKLSFICEITKRECF